MKIRQTMQVAMVSALALVLPGCGSEPGVSTQNPEGLVALVNSTAPYDDAAGTSTCAGIAVDDLHVLTAAHCIEQRQPEATDVIVGAGNLCRGQPVVGQRIPVVSWRVLDGDAALLTLAAEADVPVIDIGALTAVDEVVTAWGWGAESPGGPKPCEPEAKSLRIVGLHQCASVLAVSAVGDYFCAVAEAERNTCTGDSGGPVFNSEGKLVGIVAGGDGCAADDPGTYWAVVADSLN